MSEGRSLRAIFSELLGDDVARQAYAADPDGALGDAGHGELPDELVAEAIVSFADTAPSGVAEHLAPFVMAHSVVTEPDGAPPASAGLDLLASAPPESPTGADGDPFGAQPEGLERGGDVQADATPLPDDLDFGGGAGGTPPRAEPTDTPADAAVPFADNDAADVPVEPFPAPGLPPTVPEPEPDEAQPGDGEPPG